MAVLPIPVLNPDAALKFLNLSFGCAPWSIPRSTLLSHPQCRALNAARTTPVTRPRFLAFYVLQLARVARIGVSRSWHGSSTDRIPVFFVFFFLLAINCDYRLPSSSPLSSSSIRELEVFQEREGETRCHRGPPVGTHMIDRFEPDQSYYPPPSAPVKGPLTPFILSGVGMANSSTIYS